MEEETSADDKPYAATQRKLDEARRKGDIARSTDLNTALGYVGFVLAFLIWGEAILLGFGEAISGVFHERFWDAADLKTGGTGALVKGHLLQALVAIAPVFALPIILVLGSIAGQRAFIFTGDNVAPKVSRISIISNAKKKFGRQGLFEFLKSFVKLALFTAALVYYIKAKNPEIVISAMYEARQVILLMGDMGLGFFSVALLIAASIGLIDYFWQQAEHQRKQRMTHKEMMDEVKNSEGDPAMKQKRRQRGMDIARTQMLKDVKDADVIIVNPEHYAVALKWERKPGTAPICVAKGVDEMAATIRRLANENGVPIYREPPTARALYAAVELGEEISSEHYRAVAAAIRFAETMRAKQRNSVFGSP